MSGAVAERVKLHSYIIFAMFNTIAYSIPAHWIWGGGFLADRGVVDIAGSGRFKCHFKFLLKITCCVTVACNLCSST